MPRRHPFADHFEDLGSTNGTLVNGAPICIFRDSQIDGPHPGLLWTKIPCWRRASCGRSGARWRSGRRLGWLTAMKSRRQDQGRVPCAATSRRECRGQGARAGARLQATQANAVRAPPYGVSVGSVRAKCRSCCLHHEGETPLGGRGSNALLRRTGRHIRVESGRGRRRRWSMGSCWRERKSCSPE